MKQFLLTLFASGLFFTAQAQQGVTHSGHLTGQSPFPLTTYTELSNPAATPLSAWQARKKNIVAGWGSTLLRCEKEKPILSNTLQNRLTLKAWRGERISAQWVISTKKTIDSLHVTLSPFYHRKKRLTPKTQLSFIRYVMTDELNKGGGGCGYRQDASKFDSSLVADVIDTHILSLDVAAYTTRSGRVTIDIPHNATPGLYKSILTLSDKNGKIVQLPLQLEVKEHTLPTPSHWKFHLDLWQNPYAVARYHKVPLWSAQHFDALKPYMEMYRDAGGKVITASIMNKPWNGQTYDAFGTMVTWMKRSDGTWAFDYNIFDRWVNFNDSIGLKGQINCYTMIPWHLAFQYYDQATNSLRSIRTAPGEKAYEELWSTMLTSFAQHLKEKGWFERTYISMDERPMKAMLTAINIIKKADPKFKVALAGNLHDELIDLLDDYCIPMRQKYNKSQLEKRRKAGKITTYYTCCTENFPNTFTFSPAAEAEWIPWYAENNNLDGYLRWAYNSWVLEPLLDSRFYTWAAGDTYMVYPGGRSSVRFENLRDGIESIEKIHILRKKWTEENNNKALKELDDILNKFNDNALFEHPAKEDVETANKWLNKW